MTNAANIFAGSRITASMLAGIAPMCVIKGAGQSLASSVTLQDDDALYYAVQASHSYWWQCLVVYTGAATGSGDLKFQWDTPAGATLWYTDANITIYGNPSVGTAWQAASKPTAGSDGTTPAGLLMTGTLMVGSTAGELQFTWAQNNSSGTATEVLAGSGLVMWDVT